MSFKKVKILVICLAGSYLGMPAAAVAGASSGIYLGAGTGNSTVQVNSFDESDTAYKVFGGYNIGFIPLVDFAVEASYVDFGNPSSSAGNVDVTGLDAFGLAGLSFGPFGVFAKAGAINWSSDSTLGSGTSDSGTDSAYGVGARFAIGPFAVRAEYEVFNIPNADLDMVSISGVFTF